MHLRWKVSRVTHRKISSWISKFGGEIVGIDVVYPFLGSHQRKSFPKIDALMTVCCLTRFCVCSQLSDLTDKTASAVFTNDRFRFVGKPRRIITDAGPPELIGPEWGRLSHVFFWQMVAAPPRSANRGGIPERIFRNLKIAVRAIITDATMVHGQDLLTMASIARNHVPHSVTGIPPVMAMAGRSDLLAGAASTIFDPDPASGGILSKQQMACGIFRTPEMQ